MSTLLILAASGFDTAPRPSTVDGVGDMRVVSACYTSVIGQVDWPMNANSDVMSVTSTLMLAFIDHAMTFDLDI